MDVKPTVMGWVQVQENVVVIGHRLITVRQAEILMEALNEAIEWIKNPRVMAEVERRLKESGERA
jgi:hypothetical protein